MSTPPIIELRLLGSLSVRTAAGCEPAAVLSQPKRLALLAYLAAATPHGFRRRDTLLALFWPEADGEHARTSLRKALHFLRNDLGSEAVVSRGDEEVGLDRDRCWCDAVAFEEAVDAGRSDQALGLYQGDLLAGFHVSDAPEFERWLEETRARLRGRAASAAWTLAEEAGASARPSLAVQWGRRAAGFSPYDEVGIRRLVTLLDHAGDRAGAIVAYEQFARRLSADLDLEPSADTIALVEVLRTRNGSRPSYNRPDSETQESRTGPEGAPAAAAPGAPPQGFLRRRRSARLRLSLMALGATTVIGAVVWRSRSPHHLPASPTAIAVLPFDYRGNPEFSYLAEGMVDLMSTRLDGAAGLRSIDPRALLKFMSQNRGGADPRRGRLAAEHFGAGRFVLGSIVEAGGRLQFSATLYDSSATPRSSVEALASVETQIFDVADRLAGHILAEVQDAPLELARVADRTTASLPAFKAYVEGERELRAGRTTAAGEAFQRATELDPAFALAHYRAGMLAHDMAAVRVHLAQAMRYRGRLAEHQRGLVEALDAYSRGDDKAAEQRFREVVAAYPDDAEAWTNLGAVIGYRANLHGGAWVDARDAYERVLALDPRSRNALWQLAAYTARDGRRAELDSLTDRFLQLDPPRDYAVVIRGQRAIVMGDTAELERFIAALRRRPDPSAQRSAGWVVYTTGDLSTGRRLWRLFTEPSHSPGMRVLAHGTLAKIELTNGRWEAAQSELGRAAALDAGAALELRGYFALTGFLRPTRTELVALRDSIQRWNPTPTEGTEDGLSAMHRPVRRHLRHYLLGMVSARLGDEAAALRYAAELERVDSSSPGSAFAAGQAQIVRAEVAWRGGRPVKALTTLERPRLWIMHSDLDGSGDSPFYTRLHERFARAELLYALGRYEEALPWYRGLAYDLLYTGPAHLRLAQIYQARGERQKAIEHYTAFIGLWRECDPMLQPMVQEAESALARLR